MGVQGVQFFSIEYRGRLFVTGKLLKYELPDEIALTRVGYMIVEQKKQLLCQIMVWLMEIHNNFGYKITNINCKRFV